MPTTTTRYWLYVNLVFITTCTAFSNHPITKHVDFRNVRLLTSYDDENERSRRSNRRSTRRSIRSESNPFVDRGDYDFDTGEEEEEEDDDDFYFDDERRVYQNRKRRTPFLQKVKTLFRGNGNTGNVKSKRRSRDRIDPSATGRRRYVSSLDWDVDVDMKDHLYEDDEYLERQSEISSKDDDEIIDDVKVGRIDEDDDEARINKRKRASSDRNAWNGHEEEINFERNASSRRRRARQTKSDYVVSDFNEPTWTQEEVASWFKDEYDDDENFSSGSVIDDVFDNWRQSDHNQRKKAAEWDKAYSYDIRRSRRSQQARRVDSDVVDVEVEDFQYEDSPESQNESRRRRTRRERQIMEERRRKKFLDEQRELEELERVPPEGMGAWGPEGAVSMDIREMAIMEALKEIENAKQSCMKQEERLDSAEKARLKAQEIASQQRKRVYERRDYISASEGAHLRAQLRRLDTDLAESKRNYQEADEAVRESQVILQRLETKHRALLNYNKSNESSDVFDSDKVDTDDSETTSFDDGTDNSNRDDDKSEITTET